MFWAEQRPMVFRWSAEDQVRRMLCLTDSDHDSVAAFQRLYPQAASANYGRLFRSPTLWEDMVKSITLCNCGCALESYVVPL